MDIRGWIVITATLFSCVIMLWAQRNRAERLYAEAKVKLERSTEEQVRRENYEQELITAFGNRIKTLELHAETLLADHVADLPTRILNLTATSHLYDSLEQAHQILSGKLDEHWKAFGDASSRLQKDLIEIRDKQSKWNSEIVKLREFHGGLNIAVSGLDVYLKEIRGSNAQRLDSLENTVTKTDLILGLFMSRLGYEERWYEPVPARVIPETPGRWGVVKVPRPVKAE